MSVSHTTVLVTGGADWFDAALGGNPKRVQVELVDTDSDVQVDVSFNKGSTVHDILGPFASRAVRKEYLDPGSYQVSFRCAANATVEVTVEK